MALPILLSLLCCAWLALIYLGVGGLCLRIGGLKSLPSTLSVALQCALGFAVVGNGIMVLGFAQKLSRESILIILIGLSIFAAPFLREGVSQLTAVFGSAMRILSRTPRWIAALFLLLLFGYFLRGLLPPSDFDGLMYHLPVPKLYLAHGGFYDIFFNRQADYPMLTEMNYLLGIALGNDIICKTLSFFTGLMLLAGIALTAKELRDDGSLVIPSLVIFLTFTNTIANLSECGVDMAQAAWTLMAVIGFLRYQRSGRIAELMICGILAGMAAQTKIFGLFAVPVLVIALIVNRWPSLINRRFATELAVIILPAAIMGVPWYVKSLIYKGTIASIPLHANLGSAAAGSATTLRIVALDPLLRVVQAPWSLSLFPSLHRMDTFGPLLLAVLPFLLLVGTTKQARIMLLCIGVFLLEIVCMESFFFRVGVSIRYSTFLLALGAPLIVWTIECLGGFPRIRLVMRAMVVIMVLLGSLLFVKRYHQDWRALLTMQSRDAYYRAVLPEYAAIEAINRLSDGKTVMPIYNYDDYLINAPLLTAYRTYANPEEMKRDLRAKGVGYIFSNNKLDTTDNSNAYPEIAEKERIFGENGFYLYRLTF